VELEIENDLEPEVILEGIDNAWSCPDEQLQPDLHGPEVLVNPGAREKLVCFVETREVRSEADRVAHVLPLHR
jgi:hypothetical protein